MKRMRKGLSFLLILAMLISICTPMQVEAASKVKINKTSHTMYVGQTYTLKISGTSKKATWSTSDKKVATVDSKGKVAAKKKGTATITAKVSNKKYTCKVTVKTPVLNVTKKTLYTGQTYTLKLTGATAKTFSSNNTKVATVNSKGKVTTKKAGTATITVKDTKGRKYTCKITVNKCTHTWDAGKVTKKATCTATGVKTYTCKVCKATKTESTKKIAHSKGAWEITKKETCEKSGTKVIKCTVCKQVIETKKLDPTGHDYKTIVLKPTCTKQGYTTYTCACGDTYKDNYVKETGHTWGEWTTTKEPTEEAFGEERRVCGVCKETETNTLPKVEHEHNYSKAEVTEPTCTKQGYTTHTCRCGDSYKDNYVDETGHTWGEWKTTKEPTIDEFGEETRSCGVCGETESNTLPKVEHEHDYTQVVVTAPTCTKQGYTTHTCRCGDSYKDNYVDETGHTWGKWATTKEPTEEAFGEESRSCGVCGETESNTLPKVEHEHNYSKAEVTEPTCTEQGYTTHTCRCGGFYVDSYVNETGHTWGEWKTTKEPTEEAFGEESRTCGVCGETETNTLPKVEHEHSYTSVVTEPTCTEQGYTTHTCRCGDSYKDNYVNETGHTWGEWKTTKEPTEEDFGEEARSCGVCGETETNTLQKKEHEHSYTFVVTEPTCTEQGYTTHTCKCGDSYKDTYVDETGHSYEDKVTTPTCNAQGYTTHTCACGDTYTDAYVDADDNAHIAGEWVTTKELTYTEVGTKTKSCTVCEKVLETEEIPVLELTNGDAVYTIELAGGETDYVVGHYDTELAAELVAHVNAYRVENGLTELTPTNYITKCANKRGYQTSYLWDHKTPMGSSPTAAYDYAAENLAWYVTRTSALEIFNALKNCEDHNAIMLSNYSYNNTAVSVFCKKVGENDYEYYWVQIFD